MSLEACKLCHVTPTTVRHHELTPIHTHTNITNLRSALQLYSLAIKYYQYEKIVNFLSKV